MKNSLLDHDTDGRIFEIENALRRTLHENGGRVPKKGIIIKPQDTLAWRQSRKDARKQIKAHVVVRELVRRRV